jgi:hypothetical protein
MSKLQPMPRHSLTRGAALARQINANRTIAQHVIKSTVVVESLTEPVAHRIATENMLVGTLLVRAGQPYYLVASKFAPRYYVVIYSDGKWLCSSPNRPELFIKKVLESFNDAPQIVEA